MSDTFMLGYDYKLLSDNGIKVPIYAPIGHLICVGGSGSGKSTSLLYWLYKIKRVNSDITLYIADFKKSHEFEGITDIEHFAEFENCYELICKFYEDFKNTQEGEDRIKILLIDEIAGLLSHFSITKEGKEKAERIKAIMSSILMLGRSRKCYLTLAMQRYTAAIFPSSSGAADNFFVCIGLGRLTVDGRRGLFAEEHFDGEDEILYGQGKGIVLIDGQPLRALVIPRVSKQKLLMKLSQPLPT